MGKIDDACQRCGCEHPELTAFTRGFQLCETDLLIASQQQGECKARQRELQREKEQHGRLPR